MGKPETGRSGFSAKQKLLGLLAIIAILAIGAAGEMVWLDEGAVMTSADPTRT